MMLTRRDAQLNPSISLGHAWGDTFPCHSWSAFLFQPDRIHPPPTELPQEHGSK